MELIIDLDNHDRAGLLRSFESQAPGLLPPFFRGDVIPVHIRFVRPSSGSRYWDDVDLSGYTIKIGLGLFGAAIAAYSDSWTPFPAATVSVQTLREGGVGVNEVQRVTIPSGSYGGHFTLTFAGQTTGPIAYDAGAAGVQSALVALPNISDGDVSVRADASLRLWDIEFKGSKSETNVSEMIGDASGLLVPVGCTFYLDLTSPAMDPFFVSADEAEAVFEIEMSPPGGDPETIYQNRKARVFDDLIDSTSVGPTPGPTYYTAAQVDQMIVLNGDALGISGLTGGGASNLDGRPTAGVSVGRMIAIMYGGSFGIWRLVAGTDPEVVPGVIRPDDYASGTNEKVWKQVL